MYKSGTALLFPTLQARSSAVEEAFRVFVSTKTEILNDQLAIDEITSVSSGNIQDIKYFRNSNKNTEVIQ